MATSAAEYLEVRWRVAGTDETWSAPRRTSPVGEIVVEELDRTQTYEFEVRAVSSCGAKSVWVPSDYTVPVPPTLPPPNIPNTSGVADGVQLDWSDAAGGSRGDLTYEIQRSASADGPWTTVAKVRGTSWVDAVTDTASYYYRIRAIDYNGNVSEWVIISTPANALISTPELAAQTGLDVAALRDDFDAVQGQADDLRDDVDATIAQVQTMQGQIGDILQADEWVSTKTYPKGDLVQLSGKLYRSLQAGNINHAPTTGASNAWWEYIGNYASLGEAVSATAANVAVNTNKITQNTDDITATSQSLATVQSTVSGHSTTLTSYGTRITTAETTIGTQGAAISATATDVALLGASNAGKTAFNLNSSTVKIDGGQTLAQTISGLQVADGELGSRVDSEQSARISGDAANSTAITAVQAQLVMPDNLVSKPIFDDGSPGAWSGSPTVQNTADSGMAPHKVLRITASAYDTAGRFQATPGEKFDCNVICSMFNAPGTGVAYQRVQWFDLDGATIGYSNGPQFARGLGSRTAPWVAEAPTGVATGRCGFAFSDSGGGYAYLLAPSIVRITPSVLANASVISSMTAGVTTGGSAYAQALVLVDANGRIGGTRLASDGTTTSFDVVADRFSVSGTGQRTEFSDNSWKVYADSTSVPVVQLGKLS